MNNRLFVFVPALTFLLLGKASPSHHNQSDVYLLVLAPFRDQYVQPLWDGGHHLVPAVQLAVWEIQNRSDLLPGLNLKIIIANSGCDIHLQARLSQVEHVILGPRPLLGIVGPACSEAAVALAPLQNRVKSVQITVATTSLLDEHDKYPFTFGVVTSALIYVDAISTLMKDKGWNKVAVLYQIDREYHVLIYTDFLRRIPHDGIVFASGVTDTYIPLDEVFDSGARIVIVFASNERARKVMCLAYHKKLRFPAFQFIFTDRQPKNLIKQTSLGLIGGSYKCNKATMERSLSGSIFHNYDLSPISHDRRLESGEQYGTFLNNYIGALNEYSESINENLSLPNSEWYHPYYDSTWVIALSANACLAELQNETSMYRDCIHRNVYEIEFLGTTGTVKFNKTTGHSSTVIRISQVLNGTVDVGRYNAGAIMYSQQAGEFISDSFTPHVETVSLALSVIVGVMTVLALLCTIFFHAINVCKRHYHSIKATSPTLNHLVFTGCYSLILVVTMVNVQYAYPFTNTTISSVLCNADVWTLSVAFTLIFGTLAVKCWRLYCIFKHTFDKRTGALFTDKVLFTCVVLLLAIDVALLLIMTLVAGVEVKRTTTLDTSEEMPVLRSRTSCQYSWGYLVPLGVYKCLLASIVVFFSIHNRHIKITNFRHTRAVNILAYSLTIIFGLGVPMYFLLRDVSTNVALVVLSTLLLSMVYLCLILLFWSPSLPLLKQWFYCKISKRICSLLVDSLTCI